MPRIFIPVLAFFAFLFLAAPARPEDPLKVIPAQAEVIININIRTIADSEAFKRLQEMHPEIDAQVAVIQNLTGINVTRDSERVVVFGKMNQKDIGGIVFVGKYDKEKMLTLLRANPKFKETTVDGLNAYEWMDGKKKQMRYAAVLPDDTAVICNSKATAEACLAAIKDPAQSFAGTPQAALMPPNAAQAAAWALVVNRSDQGPAAKYRIASIYGTVALESPNVVLTLGLTPQDGADVAKWVDIARGLVAIGQLQPDKVELREIAAAAKAVPSADGKAATLTISVEQGKLLRALGKEKSAAK